MINGFDIGGNGKWTLMNDCKKTGHNIERISALSAFKRAQSNGLRRYPAPDRDGDRLYPLAGPEASPSFKIREDDTIFAIGSCFARNVEKTLESAGKRVLSREFSLGEIGKSIEDATNFFNKYSIHSIINEVRWALERETFPGEDALYAFPTGKGQYFDAQLGMARLDFPVETILQFRNRYLDAMATVVEADVVILTLGYVETWYDRKLDLYLNVAPPRQILGAEPDRFEFRVLSYSDVLEGLNVLHALLIKHRKKPLKMLVTVSPVPLLSTFRDMDVLVANAYSKSVQRAAIDEFVLDKEGVDYFPSYEFVILSNPAVAWARNDYRHVSSDVIARIMSNVLISYMGEDGPQALKGETMTQDALLSSAKMLLKLEQFEETLNLLQENRSLADENVDILMIEATVLRRTKKLADAFDVLKKVTQIAPERHDALERMITLCRPLRNHSEARELLDIHLQNFPARDEFRKKIIWI